MPKRLPFQPRKSLPKLRPIPPSTAQLERLQNNDESNRPTTYPRPFPSRRILPLHIRRTLPKGEKFVITDLLKPLPTTFQAGESLETWNKSSIINSNDQISTTPLNPHHDFPYRYFQISLRKSLIGMSGSIKHIAQSLGLFKRHQVVWRTVSPRSAGQILKIKELVGVKLVHEIPEKFAAPTGFNKIASSIIH